MSAIADGDGSVSGERLPRPSHPGSPNSQSPLEMMTSLRGARLGSRGLMRSSTVTAAMALMLVDAVLEEGSTKEVGVLRPHQGTGHLLPPGLTCWRKPPATHTNWPARTQPKPRAEAWAAESF